GHIKSAAGVASDVVVDGVVGHSYGAVVNEQTGANVSVRRVGIHDVARGVDVGARDIQPAAPRCGVGADAVLGHVQGAPGDVKPAALVSRIRVHRVAGHVDGAAFDVEPTAIEAPHVKTDGIARQGDGSACDEDTVAKAHTAGRVAAYGTA